MDTTTLFLFEKIRRNEAFDYTELFNYIILIPLITYVIQNFNKFITFFSDNMKDKINIFKKSENQITLEAVETLESDGYIYNYPRLILGVCHYIKYNQIKVNFKVVRTMRSASKDSDYVITNCENLRITDNIKLTVKEEQNEESKKKNQIVIKYIFNYTITDIDDFLDKCLDNYSENVSKKNKNKLFHFIYKGNDNFSRSVISDIKNNPNLETFDKLMNEHSVQIQKDILRLKNLDYYRKTGLKRKKGYLFYGEPGCGKTSTVMAMANFDNRHIIEIPLSRVKTNQEIEHILNLDNEWLFEYKKSEVIILFDEIDCGTKSIETRKEINRSQVKNEDKNEEIKSMISTLSNAIKKDEESSISYTSMSQIQSQPLDLGTILSRLDGIGNYNGLIIVATTNHKDKLDPALYRELRLTPVQFNFSRKEDMIQMIEQFYEIKLKDNEKIRIPDRNAKISPAKFRCLLEKFEDNYKDLLKHLSNL